MIHKLAALAVLALAVAGCHAQIPSNPITYACPAATTGTWTPLETGATEITGTSSKDTPGVANWCYAVESANNTYNPIALSVPSNVVLVTTTTADPVVDLTWQPPSSTPVPITGYIVYRIAAVSSTIAPTLLNAPTTSISSLEKPSLPLPQPAEPAYALLEKIKPVLTLKASVK